MVSVKDDIAPWNREYSKYVFQSGAENAGKAFQNFIKSRTGKIKSKSGFPKYKSRKSHNQVGCLFANLKLDENRIFIPRVGWIKFYESNKTILWLLANGARITQGTLKYQHARWTMSVNIKMTPELALKYYTGRYNLNKRKKQVKGKTIGGDVGVKTFLTLSDGTQILSPRTYEKQLAKLRRLNKRLARRSRAGSKIETVDRTTGELNTIWSNRHDKALKQVQKQNAKVYDQRNNFLHNVSKTLIMNYETISVEKLTIAGMIKNKHLSKSISNASWGEFIRQLEYKSLRVGAELVKIPLFTPTSKTCSECGTVKTKLSLSQRTFNCDDCGISLDRDLNAAINIHKLAVGNKQYKKELNLRVAGSIKARGVGSSGEVWSNMPYETTLLRSENSVKTKDTQVLYTGNNVKTTTLLT